MTFATGEPNARVLIGSPDGHAARDLGRAIRSPDGPAPGFIQVASAEALANAAWEMFDLPLGNVLFPAWNKCEGVKKAKAKTKQTGGTQFVDLFEHTIKSTHEPKIVLEVEGVPAREWPLTLVLELKLTGAVLTVSRGHVTGVDVGTATGTASLGTGNQTPIKTRPVKVNLHGIVPPEDAE